MHRITSKHRRRLKRPVRAAIEYLTVIAADILIYALWLRPYAIAQRGSALYGGEFLFVFTFPFMWAMMKTAVRDVREWFRDPEVWER
jgi:hypothetical protein